MEMATKLKYINSCKMLKICPSNKMKVTYQLYAVLKLR